jgi:predicted transcriptional regulator
MALNKKELFAEDEVFMAEMARALAHPARIRILKILAEQNSCICGEIVEVLPLAQSTVSQHLIELKKIGLVQGTINGPKSCYCIHPENFKKFQHYFSIYFTKISDQLNNSCC